MAELDWMRSSTNLSTSSSHPLAQPFDGDTNTFQSIQHMTFTAILVPIIVMLNTPAIYMHCSNWFHTLIPLTAKKHVVNQIVDWAKIWIDQSQIEVWPYTERAKPIHMTCSIVRDLHSWCFPYSHLCAYCLSRGARLSPFEILCPQQRTGAPSPSSHNSNGCTSADRSHVRLASIHPTPAALIISFALASNFLPSIINIHYLHYFIVVWRYVPFVMWLMWQRGWSHWLHTPAIKFPTVVIEV